MFSGIISSFFNIIWFKSADGPTDPQQPIKRITSSFPNRKESPFYREDGSPLEPLAKLHLTRQKLYEKTCDFDASEPKDYNCDTTSWTAWSPCSKIDGNCASFRQRQFVNPDAEKYCEKQMVQTRPCSCENKEAPASDESKCETSEWGEWSGCSEECGQKVKVRERYFLEPQYSEACEQQLEETEECDEEGEQCEEEDVSWNKIRKIKQNRFFQNCPDADWDKWTPCNATSEEDGIKERYRIPKNDSEDGDTTCNFLKQTVVCKFSGENSEPTTTTEANPNSIPSEDQTVNTEANFIEAQGISSLPVINCKVSNWSVWGPCQGKSCKKGYQFKHRNIQVLFLTYFKLLQEMFYRDTR